MKIEGNRPNVDTDALKKLERAEAEAQKAASAAPSRAGNGDRVELSADVALANDAVKAAADAPEIRSELVERMRALMNEGKLGADSGALADSLIDSMMGRK